MDTLHAKAEWERVDERWFRKTQQYTSIFDESLDLDTYIVAGAPYAGALGKLARTWTCRHDQPLLVVTLLMAASSPLAG